MYTYYKTVKEVAEEKRFGRNLLLAVIAILLFIFSPFWVYKILEIRFGEFGIPTSTFSTWKDYAEMVITMMIFGMAWGATKLSK